MMETVPVGIDDQHGDDTNSPASSELPPLRIHHFLAWTAVAAVVVAIITSVSKSFDNRNHA